MDNKNKDKCSSVVSKNQCFLFVHNFAYFFSFLLKTCIFKKYLFKQILTTPFIYVFISLCVNKSLCIYIFVFKLIRNT